MTSIDFGLIMTAYGIVSVFSILLLLIIVSEILKRRFREEASQLQASLKEENSLTEEEVAAVSAAIGSYLTVSPTTTDMTDSGLTQAQPAAWSMAGRIDVINKRIRE